MTIDAGHITLAMIAILCALGWVYEHAYHDGRDDAAPSASSQEPK